MTPRRHLSYWQNCVNHLQVPLMQALARLPDTRVHLVAPVAQLAVRTAHGWLPPDTTGVEVSIDPSPGAIDALLAPPPDAQDLVARIFSGLHAYPFVRRALHRALDAPRGSAINGVFAEPRDHTGLLGPLRRMHSRVHAWRYGSRLDFLLTTGELGMDWYRRCGFPARKLFEFGYVVPTPEGPPPEPAPTAPPRIVFLAELCHRKALDLLLVALKPLADRPWHLHVVGTGQAAPYRRLASWAGLQGRVTFHGPMPYPEAMAFLATTDLLVLPSRYDGWGAVVNEALLRGVPAITSSACGAASLVRGLLGDSWVFRTAVPLDLERALTRALTRPLDPAQRAGLRQAAHRTCSAAALADYFLAILAHVTEADAPRPLPPWRSDPSQSPALP